MVKERNIVVVSRQYKDTAIKHRVVHASDHIRIEMDLDKFVLELAQKMGPTVAVTRAQLQAKIQQAATEIVVQMKDSTRFAPLDH